MTDPKARDVIAEALICGGMIVNPHELAADVESALREAGLLAEWRKIDADNPPTDGPVLVSVLTDKRRHRTVVGEAYWHQEDKNWWWAQTGPGEPACEPIAVTWSEPTHFMPLPSPPRDTSPGEESP